MVVGSVYVFWKCKDRKVCIDLGGRGLELQGEAVKHKEPFVDGRKEAVQKWLGIGSVSGVSIEGSVRGGHWP